MRHCCLNKYVASFHCWFSWQRFFIKKSRCVAFVQGATVIATQWSFNPRKYPFSGRWLSGFSYILLIRLLSVHFFVFSIWCIIKEESYIKHKRPRASIFNRNILLIITCWGCVSKYNIPSLSLVYCGVFLCLLSKRNEPSLSQKQIKEGVS